MVLGVLVVLGGADILAVWTLKTPRIQAQCAQACVRACVCVRMSVCVCVWVGVRVRVMLIGIDRKQY